MAREGGLFIVRESPNLQYEFSKMLFSFVRKFRYLPDYNSKSVKFKKFNKIGLLQIVFPIFYFFRFLFSKIFS